MFGNTFFLAALKFRYKAGSLVPTPRACLVGEGDRARKHRAPRLSPSPPRARHGRGGEGGRERGWLGSPILFTHEASSWGSQNLISEFQSPQDLLDSVTREVYTIGNLADAAWCWQRVPPRRLDGGHAEPRTTHDEDSFVTAGKRTRNRCKRTHCGCACVGRAHCGCRVHTRSRRNGGAGQTVAAPRCPVADAFRTMWLSHNKPQGIETIHARFGMLDARYAEMARRIDELLAGSVNSIPELDCKCPSV